MHLDLDAINFRKFRIRDRDSADTIAFELNPPQKYLHETLLGLAARGEPMWAIVLKARRLGISTDCSFLNVCHCTAFPNAQAMSVAHRAKNVRSMFRDARSGHQLICH